MPDPKSPSLQVAPIDSGYVFRIEGRGTARESKVFHQQAESLLTCETCQIVIDVSTCEYLDSTFLGSIADLFRRFGQSVDPQFAVHGARPHCKSLFGPTRLDTVLTIHESPPATTGEFEDIAIQEDRSRAFGQHVMRCHKRLAEIESPNQKIFAGIADRMAKELGEE